MKRLVIALILGALMLLAMAVPAFATVDVVDEDGDKCYDGMRLPGPGTIFVPGEDTCDKVAPLAVG